MSAEDVVNWDILKHLFQVRFIPPEYLNLKNDEFSYLRQVKMSATEYHRKFTDLSSYCPETAANPKEMLRLFKKGTRKKLRYMATTTPYSTYQEFFEALLQVEDSKNAPNDEDEDDVRNAQKNSNRGQSSLGP